MNVVDTKLELALERTRFWMDKAVASAGSLIYQTQLVRNAESSIVDGDRWMTTGYEEFNKLEEEVEKRQPFVKFTPVLEENILDIYNEVKHGVLANAQEKVKNMETYYHMNTYKELIGAKLPVDKTLVELIDGHDYADSGKVVRQLHDVRGDFAAGNMYEALVKADLVRNLIQKRVKVSMVRRAIQ